ncbi:MAG: hypothetical protein AAGI30_11415 [Planctomycetota bacterium]
MKRYVTGLASLALAAAPHAQTEDCNGDGVEDSAQIAAEPMLDCDENGVLDACDLRVESEFSTGELPSPGGGVATTTTLEGVLPAFDATPMMIEAKGDFSLRAETIMVTVNGAEFGPLFNQSFPADCQPLDPVVIEVPASVINAGGGSVTIEFTGSALVNGSLAFCSDAFVRATFVGGTMDPTLDSNSNDILDICEQGMMCPGDVNGDFRSDNVDFLQFLVGFGKVDADLSDGDLDGDGVVGGSDLIELLVAYGTVYDSFCQEL